MSLKFVVFSAIALTILFAQSIEGVQPVSKRFKPIPLITCENKVCGPNEQCTYCNENFCNTYSCPYNPDGKTCKAPCVEGPARCMCNPGYGRQTPDAPCTLLDCYQPQPQILPRPLTPIDTSVQGSCETVDCGPNATCATCQPCVSEYSCDNKDGSGIMCTMQCKMIKPTCFCTAGHHRETPNGPCVPLKC